MFLLMIPQSIPRDITGQSERRKRHQHQHRAGAPLLLHGIHDVAVRVICLVQHRNTAALFIRQSGWMRTSYPDFAGDINLFLPNGKLGLPLVYSAICCCKAIADIALLSGKIIRPVRGIFELVYHRLGCHSVLFQLSMEPRRISGITGHADHNELLNYFRDTGGRKSKVYLVHGEKECSSAMHQALQDIHQGDIEIARLNTTVTC